MSVYRNDDMIELYGCHLILVSCIHYTHITPSYTTSPGA